VDLIQTSIKKPVTVIVGIILILLFGLVAFYEIPVQLNPTIESPEITVSTSYFGAAPFEIEDEVTNKLEEQLTSVENLKELVSVSSENQSQITCRFDWGVNKDVARLDVSEKVDLVGDLPDDADEPVISAVSSREHENIMWISCRAENMELNKLYKIADDAIKPRLDRVPGVGLVQLFGGEEEEVHVFLDFKAMTARGITVSQVRNALIRENRNIKGGDLDQAKRNFVVRTVGQYSSKSELENTIVGRSDDTPVYLKDIAQVKIEGAYQKRRFAVRKQGQPSLIFGVRKKTGANVVKVCGLLRKEIDAINAEYKDLGLRMRAVYAESDYIDDSVTQVKGNIIIGAILAVLILILFLKSLRSIIIISFAIPISLIATFMIMWLLGRTVNVISLAGLAFASGMVVDNAIVVLENIFRHMQMGQSAFEAACKATREVWGAILAATLTTLAVFIPVIFIQEEAGQLFRDIAIAISCAVAFSLLVSLTVIPMMANKLLRVSRYRSAIDYFKNGKRFGGIVRTPFLISDSIGKGIRWLFISAVRILFLSPAFKLGFIALVALGFYLTIEMLIGMPKEYLPTGNRNFVIVFAQTHPGTSLAEKEALIKNIENAVDKVPAVKEYFAVALPGTLNFSGAIIDREKVRQEPWIVDQSVGQLQGMLFTQAPGFKYAFAFKPAIFGTRRTLAGKSVSVVVAGKDFEVLQGLADRIRDYAQSKRDWVNLVRSSFELGRPELQVKVDREKASALGLSASDIGTIVETLVDGVRAGKYRARGEEKDIRLLSREGYGTSPQDLKNLLLQTPTGKYVRLDEIASVTEGFGPTEVQHIDRDRSIELTIDLKEGAPMSEVIGDIEKNVVSDLRTANPSYRIKLVGSASDLYLTWDALKVSFIFAIIVIYLLMSSLFESFTYPFIILFSVPVAASGAILALYAGGKVLGTELDVITMLGFILLTGVVVNNAILIVYQALHFRRDGLDPNAAIIESCKVRIRPIFMSTLSSVFGMLPLALRPGPGMELYSGLGVAVVGGLALSTVFTLVLIPAVFSLVIDFQNFLKRAAGIFSPE